MNKKDLLTELEKRGVKLWVDNDKLNLEAPKGVLTSELLEALAEHKSEIMRSLSQIEINTNSLPIIKPDTKRRYEPFPLTEIQQAYWVGRSGIFDLGNVAINGYIEFETKNLDLSKLSTAWQKLIERHDMLRAIVLPTGEQKILEKVPNYNISRLDLRGQSTQEIDTQLETLREQLSHQILQSDRWPLFDIRATYLDNQRVRLHINIDLLMMDAASIRILFYEWNQFYQNPDLFLPPLELSFRDYVINKNSLENSDLIKRSLLYWFNRLETLPPAPELPLACLPTELKDYRFKRRRGQLDATTWKQLKQKGKNLGLTPSVIVLTAFAEILTRWSQNPRFTLNLTVFERLPLHPQVNQIIGDFTNTCLLTVEHSVQDTFKHKALRLQQQLLQDLDHLQISGVQVLRELARRRKTGLSAIMPIVFTSLLGLNSVAQSDLEINFLGEEIYSISQTPQVWLDHQVSEQNEALVFNWDVVEDLFPVGLLDEMFSAYCNFLEQLAQDEQIWQAPRRVLLPVEPGGCVVKASYLHTLFFKQVSVNPEQVAVISRDCTLTYQELSDRATTLGYQLQQLGASPNQLIAIVMEKGWEQVVAVLGILASGAAYVPIDPELPTERRWELLQQAEVITVLTQTRLDITLDWPENLKRICVDSDFNQSVDVETLHATSLHKKNPKPLLTTAKPEDLAYVIYTSGSTGKPKGVMISHEGAVNTILDINQRFTVKNTDRVLALSSLSFDLSVYDIFGTLAAGGTIIIPEPTKTKDPNHWSELIIKHQVTLWNSVPALMQLLIDYALIRPEISFHTLKLVLLSGDWIPLNLPNQIKALCEQAEIISLGGATEASIWSIFYPIKQIEPNWKSIPYGRPMTNQQFYVFNKALEPRPVWVTGELYIGGIGLAKGYWRDEEKTKDRFIIHPQTGERLYKTGDLGRYLPDGNIEFLGREDFQVKINGYRIELGEIESALQQHPAVKEGVVTAIGEGGNKSLMGYVIPKFTINSNELRQFLKEKLPEYMIPSAFVLLDSLPLTSNGKIDRRALPQPDFTKSLSEKTFELPRNLVEEKLAQIWAETFQIEQISIHQDFFELGGNSFLALQLIAKINQQFTVKLSLGMLFQYPTMAEIANLIVKETDEVIESTCLVPIQIKGTKPPLFCIHPSGGQIMAYQPLAAYFASERPVYGVQSRAINDPLQEHNSIDNMAIEYAKAICQHQPDGPYYLMGWSMGGIIAVSVAKVLEEQEQKVDFVGLIDSILGSNDETNFDSDPLQELALVLGGGFVEAYMNLDSSEQQSLRQALMSLPSEKRLEKMVIWAQNKNLLPKNIGIELLQKQLKLTQIHEQLLKKYRPPQIKANFHVWSASDQLKKDLSLTDWSQYTTGLTYTEFIEGNHFTIMGNPSIKTLAERLQDCLKCCNQKLISEEN